MSAEPSPTDAAARGARRRERTRAAVLDAAEELLSTEAPERIRVEDLAARAGVSPASIYLHFGTKDAVVAAVVERLMRVAAERMRAAYEDEAPPLERFRRVGAAYLGLLLDHPAVVKYVAVTGERAPLSDAERDAEAQMIALREEFEAQISAVVEAGQMRPVDPRLLSYFLFGAWNGVAALALRQDSLALTRDEVGRAVLQASLALVEGLQPSDQQP